MLKHLNLLIKTPRDTPPEQKLKDYIIKPKFLRFFYLHREDEGNFKKHCCPSLHQGKGIQLTVMEETTVTYCFKKIKLGDSIYLKTT